MQAIGSKSALYVFIQGSFQKRLETEWQESISRTHIELAVKFNPVEERNTTKMKQNPKDNYMEI